MILGHDVQRSDDKAIEAATTLTDRLLDQGMPITDLFEPTAKVTKK